METPTTNSQCPPRTLVTGASRGIGRAVAVALAQAGHDIAVHYVRDKTAALKTADDITQAGRHATVLQFDVADRAACRSVLESDMEENGAYFGVVCNAGISNDGIFPMLSGDDWDQVIQTNLDGFYNVLAPVMMPMIKRRQEGRIVTLSSVSGLVGNRGQVNYSAAKAGIIGASKALALELARRNITVNCVAPGLIETDMTNDAPREEMLKLIPAGRMGQPHEVAAVVRFLMSEEAAYITRQVISVNGGLI